MHRSDNEGRLEDWQQVTISYDTNKKVYIWQNKAQVKWKLQVHPANKDWLSVGSDCPFYKQGYIVAIFTSGGVWGPRNEFFERKGKIC